MITDFIHSTKWSKTGHRLSQLILFLINSPSYTEFISLSKNFISNGGCSILRRKRDQFTFRQLWPEYLLKPWFFWHRILYYFWRLSAPYMLAPLNPALITFYNLSTIVSNNSRCDLPVDYVLLWKEEMPGSKDWNDSQLYNYAHCLSSSNLSKYKRVNKLLQSHLLF
jgi:hypothetical protein